jgi:hypothetical protein
MERRWELRGALSEGESRPLTRAVCEQGDCLSLSCLLVKPLRLGTVKIERREKTLFGLNWQRWREAEDEETAGEVVFWGRRRGGRVVRNSGSHHTRRRRFQIQREVLEGVGQWMFCYFLLCGCCGCIFLLRLSLEWREQWLFLCGSERWNDIWPSRGLPLLIVAHPADRDTHLPTLFSKPALSAIAIIVPNFISKDLNLSNSRSLVTLSTFHGISFNMAISLECWFVRSRKR